MCLSSCPFPLIPMPAFSNVLCIDWKASGLPSVCFDDQVMRDSPAPGLLFWFILMCCKWESFLISRGELGGVFCSIAHQSSPAPHSLLRGIILPQLSSFTVYSPSHPSGSSLGQKLTRFPLLKNSKRVIRKQSSNNVRVKVWALLLRSSEWSWLQGTAGHLLLGFYLTWIFWTNLPSLKYASKWFLSGISPYSISLPEEKHRNHVTVLTTTISQTPKCQLPHHYTRQDIPEPEPGPSSIVNEAGPYLKDFHLCSPH